MIRLLLLSFTGYYGGRIDDIVIPAQAGIQRRPMRESLGPRLAGSSKLAFARFRGDDANLRARLPPVCRGEVIGHGLDLVLGPQRAAPDHAVEHAFPAPAVLAVVLPHRRGVALEALAHEHLFPGAVGKSGRLGPLRLRRAG